MFALSQTHRTFLPKNFWKKINTFSLWSRLITKTEDPPTRSL